MVNSWTNEGEMDYSIKIVKKINWKQTVSQVIVGSQII